MNREIRTWLVRYLRSEISLREFYDWFVVATWDVDAVEDDATREVAAEIDLRLAEFTNGHITEEDLRREFLIIATDYTATVEIDFHIRVKIALSTASRTIRFPQSEARLVVALA